MQNHVREPLLDSNVSSVDLQESYFDVLGICCSSEVPLIESILSSVDGIKVVKVIVPTKTVIVRHDPLLASQSQIVRVLNGAKMEASVRGETAKSAKKRWPSPSTIASGVLLLLSFLKYVCQPFQWLALGSVALVIFPIALRAFTAVCHLTFGNINILVLIAAVGSIALEDYWEAATIVFLFSISEWLESLASQKASDAMTSLINLLPQRAVLAETGEEIDVSKIQVNTVISVKEGETVPVDGVVVEGNCEIDEKSLSGESYPVAKQTGSSVWAGTINVNGYIAVRTTTLAENCVLAKMTRLVEEAHGKKSQIQRYIDRCTKYYTPVVILVSASLAIFPVVLRLRDQKHWFHIALVALVSACPCSLVLSTPIAMFCALTNAAKHGVFFKGADCLESLAKVKIMAFDKTGTVTKADFEVTEFRPLMDDISLKTLLYWVSSIQSKSSHPIAGALIDFALSHSILPKASEVKDYQNFPGEGIFGCINGNEIYIGNLKLSARAGCNSAPKLEGEVYEGKTVGYVFLGSVPVGIFCLADVCRTGAKEALIELKSMGIKIAMLTGDCDAAAKYAVDQLGGAVEIVHSELLPEEKATIVKDFQKLAKTAMIGDGINDAPALATADVGISMGISGSALATETGDVILMTNDIQRIPKVTRLARNARRKILENMIFSVATKGSVVALAIAGHPVVWAAVLADVGTCLLVILNSMLLLQDTTKGPMEYCRSSALSHAQEPDIENAKSGLMEKKQNCCGNGNATHPDGGMAVKKAPSCCKNTNQSEEVKCSKPDGIAVTKPSCCKKTNEREEVKCSEPDGGMAVKKAPSCCKKTNQSEEVNCSKPDGGIAVTKPSCCKKTNEREEVKCSEPDGGIAVTKPSCCKKTNEREEVKCSEPDGGIAVKKPSCCKKTNERDEVKCSNLGEAEYSVLIESSNKKGCCSKAKCSDPSEKRPISTTDGGVPGGDGQKSGGSCKALKNQPVGGCCGGNLGGGLSEIVIE